MRRKKKANDLNEKRNLDMRGSTKDMRCDLVSERRKEDNRFEQRRSDFGSSACNSLPSREKNRNEIRRQMIDVNDKQHNIQLARSLPSLPRIPLVNHHQRRVTTRDLNAARASEGARGIIFME